MPPASASGQTYRPKTITFSGYDAPQAELLAASGLAPNAALTQPDMQAAAQHLSETGVFADVRFKFDGQELHYDLKPADNKLPARFVNFPWWDQAALEAKVEARVPLFHGSLPPDSGMQTRVVDALTALLAEQQVTASVSAAQTNDELSGKALNVEFRVDQPTVLIGAVSFSGVSASWAPQVEGIPMAALGKPFDANSTGNALKQALEHVYRNQGYLDAHATAVEVHAPVVDGGKVSVPMTIAVTEGEQYHVGKFTLTGSVLTSEEEFRKFAQLKTGDVAAENKLRMTLQSVGRPYTTHGYFHATIKADPTYDRDNHTVDYSIAVTPGDPYTMGSVEVQKLSDDLKGLFLRVWKMKAGDPFDVNYAPGFLTSNKGELHALDGYVATYKQTEHLDTHVVDLQITFKKFE